MKSVVIIGGGFAGSHTARFLQKKFKVTLIDKKAYFEFTPSILSAITNPNALKKIHMDHKKYLPYANVVVGEVLEVSKNKVFTSKNAYPFDYAVIASGSHYEHPIKSNQVMDLRIRELNLHKEKIQKARRIVIIGGGLVGVEIAAELSTQYPHKKVILIHSKERILNKMPKSVSNYSAKFLMKKGVKLYTNQHCLFEKAGIFQTDKGEKISADLAFWCTGITPSSSLLEKNFPKKVSDNGYASVNEFLQFTPKIFCAGDVTNIHEEKTAQSADIQARIVARNIINSSLGKPLKKYKVKERVLIVGLGKYKGILVYRNFAITGIFPAIIKKVIERVEMNRLG